MIYSGIAAAFQRKITARRDIEAAQPTESLADLAAVVLASHDERRQLSGADLCALDSLDAITAPVPEDEGESGGIPEISEKDFDGNVLQSSAVAPDKGVSVFSNENTHTPLTTTPTLTTASPTPNTHRTRTTSKRTPKPITTLQPEQDLRSSQLLRLQLSRDYDHLRADERVAVLGKAVMLSGALDFTLNLSPARQAKLMAISPKDRVGRLGEDIQRHCRHVFGHTLPLSFVFEVSASGNLHLHGFIATDDHSPVMLAKVRSILKQVGGKVDADFRKRQAVVRVLRDHGWMRYMRKDTAKTVDFLGTETISYSSHTLSRLGRQVHEEERARLKAIKAKKTAIVTHTEAAAASDGHEPIPAPKPAQRASMAVSGIPALMAEVQRYRGMKKALDRRDTSNRGLCEECRSRSHTSPASIMIPQQAWIERPYSQ